MKKNFTAAAKLPSLPAVRAVNKKGDVEWRNEFNDLHNENGPARELANGNRSWHLFGKMHREDGPAFEQPNGAKLWFRDNQLHRDDGPAVECPDSGHYEWWKNGKKLTQDEINIILAAQENARLAAERKEISEQAALTVREGVGKTISLKPPLRFKAP